MHHAVHKGLFTEVQVELAGTVELRELETPAVVHILQEQGQTWSRVFMFFIQYIRSILYTFSVVHTWSKRLRPRTGSAVYIRLYTVMNHSSYTVWKKENTFASG